MRLRRLVPVLLALTSLAACTDGGDGADQVIGPGDGEATTSSTTTVDTTTTTTPDETTTTTTFAGSTSPTSIPAPPDATRVAKLVDVRLAGHEGFDRLTFEFDEQLPGIDVRYVEPPVRADGSGNPVEVDGEAFLEIRMEPASGVDLSSGEARPTYEGPERLRSDTEMVTEVVRTGDFEANLTWVAGTRRETPYRVTTLREPARVVVEFAH